MKIAMTSAMIQKKGCLKTRHHNAPRRDAKTPPGKAINTTTNNANSITSVQLTGINGATKPSRAAERNPAHEGANRVAKTAENRHHEALELIGIARKESEREQRADEHARYAGKRDAYTRRRVPERATVGTPTSSAASRLLATARTALPSRV